MGEEFVLVAELEGPVERGFVGAGLNGGISLAGG